MNRIRIIRGTIKDVTGEAGKITRCTVVGFEDEEIEEVEIFDGYGIGAVPPDNTECIALQFGHRTVVVATADRRNAIDKTAEDIELHVGENQYIAINKLGAINIKTPGTVNIDAAHINLGDGALQALINESILTYYNAHTHPAPGGSTGAPVVLLNSSMVATSVVKGV